MKKIFLRNVIAYILKGYNGVSIKLPIKEELLMDGNKIPDLYDILFYLDSGYRYVTVPNLRGCEICGEVAGGEIFYSDGVWVWSKWITHYIMAHGLLLPEDFLIHIRENDYKTNVKHVECLFNDPNIEIVIV